MFEKFHKYFTVIFFKNCKVTFNDFNVNPLFLNYDILKNNAYDKSKEQFANNSNTQTVQKLDFIKITVYPVIREVSMPYKSFLNILSK